MYEYEYIILDAWQITITVEFSIQITLNHFVKKYNTLNDFLVSIIRYSFHLFILKP